MKFNLKLLGVIYLGLGGSILVFVGVVVLMGILDVLGIVAHDPKRDIAAAITIFSVLAFPAGWILQTGWAIYQSKRAGRWSGIAIAAVLLIGLNVILLLLKERPSAAPNGIVIFHSLMILIGLYSLLVLAPTRVTSYLQ